MHIHGTGIDIIEIERIDRAIKRWGSSFIHRIFTKDEIKYAEQHVKSVQHFAARFAAKEAIFKAVSNQPNLSWQDIQILNNSDGKPTCTLQNCPSDYTVHLSISHSKYYAVANAIITTS